MKNSVILTVLVSAAVASAQVTIDNGTYTCSKPNVAFCAGDSLKTDIIIRCDSTGRGQPGRCSDNLAGEPPVGVQPALCYETDPTVGDAACEKNCVVYGASGNGNGTFTLPADLCTPTFTASSSSTSGGVSTETSTSTSTGTVTSCPGQVCESTSSSSAPETTPTTPTTTPVYPTGNGTITTTSTTKPTTKTTATPIGPTTTSPSSVPTAGAAANAVGGVLAGLGLVAAYML